MGVLSPQLLDKFIMDNRMAFQINYRATLEKHLHTEMGIYCIKLPNIKQSVLSWSPNPAIISVLSGFRKP